MTVVNSSQVGGCQDAIMIQPECFLLSTEKGAEVLLQPELNPNSWSYPFQAEP